MKVLVSALVIAILMIGAQSAYAQVSQHPQADFKSGYSHGVSDAQPHTKQAYVWQSPHGFINQTDSWIDGYVTGFCKIAGPNASMDEPEADFWCKDGPDSAGWMVGKTVTGTYTSIFPSRN